MIVRWSQHKIRPNAPQHVVLGRNVVKGYYSGALVVESAANITVRRFIVNTNRIGLR